MFRQLLLVGVVVGAAAAAGCKQKTEFKSDEYKFKATFPGKPKVEEQTVMGAKLKMFGAESRNGVCAVGVADLPIPDNESDELIQNRLDGSRDGAIKNAGGTEKSSSKITYNGKYPGREFTATITQPKPGLMRARIYLVGKRLYQVLVMGTESYANSADSTAFLDSFQILE